MKSLFVVLCLTMAYLSVGAQKIYKFQNTKLSDEKRIDALLEELMLEEKIALLGSDLAVPRLGLRTKRLQKISLFRFSIRKKEKSLQSILEKMDTW